MSWPEYSLDQIGTVSRGRSRHRPRDAAHLYDGPYPFVQTADVKHAGLYLSDYSQTYSEAGLAQSRLWPEGTLCITIAANIAETSILKIPACFPDSIIGFIPDEEKSDARFVKYLFDATFKRKYKAFTQGAAQDNLSQGKLLSLKFPTPHIDEQKEIADRLSTYDDLIANNRRRIELLEESARQLYKEWFVRFRFPGHEHVKILDGIPERWSKSPLHKLIDVIKQSISPTELSADHPYIGLEHMPRRSFTLNVWETAEKVTSSKYIFRKHDILFGKIRPYFHKVGFSIGDGITSSDTVVLRVKDQKHWPVVLAEVTSDAFIALATQTVREGSKMPRADWTVLQKRGILIPTDSILNQFNEQIVSICAQCEVLSLQNKQLTKARDLLLPRLMSGEIKV